MRFWKMHGARNDFILVDDRAGTFPASDGAWISRIAARRTGIGCDGVILIRNSDKADFQMRFFNPDGNEADMCGNGARCVARLAHDIGVAPAQMTIDTRSGILNASIEGRAVRITMTDPTDWRMEKTLDLGGKRISYDFVNSGVPHVVIQTSDLDRLDVQKLGSEIRRHADFAPAGTNVNFVAIVGPQALRIRTFERGVEAETMACGTGIVASCLTAGMKSLVKPPVKVTSAGGDVLEVDFQLAGAGAQNVTLLGPAEHVFTGEIKIV